MKKYNQYINEGIRDKMLPKSDEEILNVLSGKTDWQQFKAACINGFLWLVKKILIEDLEEQHIHEYILTGINIAHRNNQQEVADFLRKYIKSSTDQRYQLLNESNGAVKYYNIIKKEFTECLYRFKTEEEFIKEFGEDWKYEYHRPDWCNSMDSLFGINYPYNENELDTTFHMPRMDKLYNNGNNWSIGWWMLTKNKSSMPNYKPKKFDRTLESFLLEKNNSIGDAREVFMTVYNEDEFYDLKNISSKWGYDEWPSSIQHHLTYTKDWPYYIFFNLISKNVSWTHNEQMTEYIKKLDNISIFDGVYNKKFTMKDIRIFEMILRNKKIIDIPNYSPRKRVLEGVENYPYRFKTKKEMIEDFGENWMRSFGEIGWVDTMNHLLGTDYPYTKKELGEIDLNGLDHLPEANDWSVCGKMLVRNLPITPNYKPKRFKREI